MRYMLVGWMFFALACCSNGAEHPSRTLNSSAFDPTRLNYADLVANIGALRIAGTRNDGDYFFWKLPITQGLYSSADELLQLHRQMWRDPVVDKKDKCLSAKLAQCLSKLDRLDLLKDVFIEVKSGKVPDYVRLTLLSPGSQWSSWIDRNYKDADVRSALQGIADDASGSELQANIMLTLEGTGFNFLQEYGGDVAQKLHCAIEDRKR